MKNLIKVILILGTIILTGCSTESPVKDEIFPNTPPVITELFIPDETSIWEYMPNTLTVYDNDENIDELIRIDHELWETTATEKRHTNPGKYQILYYNGSTAHPSGFNTIEITTTKNGKRTKGTRKVKSKNAYNGTLFYWRPTEGIYSAEIYISVYNVHIDDLHTPINEPITFQKTVKISEANAIIPGKQMGEVYIGQHVSEIETMLGKSRNHPRSTFTHTFHTKKYINNFPIYIIANEAGNVILAAIIKQGRLSTPGWNRIASISHKHTKGEITRGVYTEFGRTKDIRWGFVSGDIGGELHVYKKHGIAFQYKNYSGIGGIVTAIAVFDQEGYNKVHVMDSKPHDMSEVTIIKG